MTRAIYDVYVSLGARNGYGGAPVEVESLQTAKAVLLHDLRIPIHIVLGRFEAASQEELEDLITDLRHELDRRSS